GGGQSAVGRSRFPLHQPGAPWARAPASGVGLGSTGLKGRKETAGRRAGRRRTVKTGAEWGRTGDIAHLEAWPVFRFFFALSRGFIKGHGSVFDKSEFSEDVRKFQALFSVRPVWGRSGRRFNRCPCAETEWAVHHVIRPGFGAGNSARPALGAACQIPTGS